MEEIKGVGRCIGCGSHTILISGGCEKCYSHPKRGKRYMELVKRVISDKSFAAKCYNKCESVAAKNFFIKMYGLPDGCTPPASLKLVENEKPAKQLAKVIQLKRP